MEIILILAVLFGLYLIFVLGYLAYLNWSYKVQASLISISLVGIGTLLVTIFSGLKDQKINTKIVSTVFVEPEALKLTGFPEEKSRFYSRSMVLKGSADMVGRDPAKDYMIVPAIMPKSDEDWYTFNQEAFIYDVFRYICVSSQSGGVFDLDPSKKTYGVFRVDLPADTEQAKINDIKAEFKWFNGYRLDLEAKELYLNLPEGTAVQFYRESLPNQREKSVLEFYKERYFKVTFSASRLNEPSADNTQKFITDKAKTTIRSYNYLLEMDAVIDKYSSSGDKSVSYVNWITSVFERVKMKYDDKD